MILIALCALSLGACDGTGSANAGYNPFANGAYGGSPFLAEVATQQVVGADRRGSLRWAQPTYTAMAGGVSFVVQNRNPVVHQFGIEGNEVKYQSDNIAPGATITFTVKALPAGGYQIVCNYANHKETGMIAPRGTLMYLSISGNHFVRPSPPPIAGNRRAVETDDSA